MTATNPNPFTFGYECIVDAFGCTPERLASVDDLSAVVQRLVADLHLHPVAGPHWHVFGPSGGITGVVLLAESHLTLHTFPERGYAAFNLYHCGCRLQWPWKLRLGELLGGQRVSVRTVPRGNESACAANAF